MHIYVDPSPNTIKVKLPLEYFYVLPSTPYYYYYMVYNYISINKQIKLVILKKKVNNLTPYTRTDTSITIHIMLSVLF